MFAISPKLDCPHLEDLDFHQVKEGLNRDTVFGPCKACNDNSENWLCLSCNSLRCSRFVNGHMAEHFQETLHPVAFSFTDASFWCYLCDEYIYSPELKEIEKKFQAIKFPKEEESSSSAAAACAEEEEEDGDEEEQEESEDDDLEHAISAISDQLGDNFEFTYQSLIEGLQSKSFQRIVVLSGAGISVAAGIPDFRSPKTGLYAQMAKFNLPYPEAVFSLEYFRETPQPFYQLSKTLFSFHNYSPVTAHHFLKLLHDQDMLLMNFTQNIDGLELAAGLPMEKIAQAHGHTRTAHCIDCAREYPITLFQEHVEKEEILYCSTCKLPPDAFPSYFNQGLVKPDIVFFGESLPKSFFTQVPLIRQADLVLVMGTSLKVYPFAHLVDLVDETVPVVLINRENPGVMRKNFLFLPGDIQETLQELAETVGWNLPTPSVTSPLNEL